MTLTSEQKAIINEYIDSEEIDSNALIAYIEKHRVIKAEVFSKCSIKKKRSLLSEGGYCIFLDKEEVYRPIDRETFLRRIPFFFYQFCWPGGKRSGLSYVAPVNQKLSAEQLEMFYQGLEWMYYDLRLDLESIFRYVSNQLYVRREKYDSGFSALAAMSMEEDGLQGREMFLWWQHYLRLIQSLGWSDIMPERFITKYNEALEASGLEPIIYRPLKDYVSYYVTDNNSYIFRGNFPCDSTGAPILKWTTIRVRNPKSISFDGNHSERGELTIGVAPNTTIHVREFYKESDDPYFPEVNDLDEPLQWRQIYAGPQTMFFNYEALREFRLERKMTQSEVAEAIETSVRTYQKWESGETTPDGHNLLRLMCWLNIDDVQSLIRYEDYDVYPDDKMKEDNK